MVDKRGARLAYNLTIHPPTPDDPRVFAIVDRHERGPSVADNLDTVLSELDAKGLDPEDIVLYRNRAGIWEEVWWGRHGFASLEPIEGEPRTVADALRSLREELLPPWSPDDPGTYGISEHGEVIAVVEEVPERSGVSGGTQVIEALKEMGKDLDRRRVVFCDVDGVWSELVVRKGQFAGSRSIHAEGLSQALENVRASDPASGPIVADSAWLQTVRDRATGATEAEIMGTAIAKGPEFAKASFGLSRPAADTQRSEGPGGRSLEEVARELIGRAPQRSKEPDDHEPER
jgi:hypothetical protein